MNQGVGVPALADEDLYLGAVLVDTSGHQRYIRKVYNGEMDDRAVNLVRFILYLIGRADRHRRPQPVEPVQVIIHDR